MSDISNLFPGTTALLTPKEQVLMGGSAMHYAHGTVAEEAYRQNPLIPVFLIENADNVNQDLIDAVNVGRASVGKIGGFATFLMFDLKGAVKTEFLLGPLDETGKTLSEVKLAYVKYADGREVSDPEQLKDIGLSEAGRQMLEQEFPSLNEPKEGNSKGAKR